MDNISDNDTDDMTLSSESDINTNNFPIKVEYTTKIPARDILPEVKIERNKFMKEIINKKLDGEIQNYAKIQEIYAPYSFILVPPIGKEVDHPTKEVLTDFIIHDKKYKVKELWFDGKKFRSILKYQPIGRRFCGLYELFYDHSKYYTHTIKMSKPVCKVLEFGESDFSVESLHYFAEKFDLKCEYDLIISKKYLRTIERENRVVDNISLYDRLFHINVVHIDDYVYDTKKKYDIIFDNYVRAPSPYVWSSYSSFISGKMMLLYFLNSLLLLENQGCLIYLMGNFVTNIQKSIFYFAKKVFDDVSLHVPHAQHVFHSSDSCYMVCTYYTPIDTNILKKIISQVLDIKEVTDPLIHCDEVSEILYGESELTACKRAETETNTAILHNFFNFPENKEYNKEIEDVVNHLQRRQMDLLHKINDGIPEKELVKYKLYKAYKWAKKYDFELQEDFNYTFMKDVYIDGILNHIFKEYPLLRFPISQIENNEKMSFDELKKITDKSNQDYESSQIYIKTRNISQYDSIKILLEYYQKLNDIAWVIGEDKTKLSQQFFEMYEICELFGLFKNVKDAFKLFSICELPGSSIIAINHYIKTKLHVNEFTWMCYDKNNKNDSLDMYKNHKDNWKFGDIKSIDTKYAKTCNLITCNCYSTENDTIQQLYFILECKVNAILKLKCPIIDLNVMKVIGQLGYFYKKVYVYKSEQSYTSDEFYIIFKNFEYNDKYKIVMEKKMIDNIDDNEEFYRSFAKHYKNIMKVKTDIIKRIVYIIDRADILNINDKTISDKINKHIEKEIDDWLSGYVIQRINKYDLLY